MMTRVALAILVGIVSTIALIGTAQAQAKPEFRLGFKALADQIPDVVGEPLENERWNPNGDSLQQTSKGLMVWRKADNWTAFTNGSRTWINGPNGVQSRGNDERFEWEGGSQRQPVASVGNQEAVTTPSETAAAARLIPSVVLIKADDGHGSGFAITDQLVLTSRHIIADTSKLSIQTSDGRQLEGSVAAKSSVLDLALIRVQDLNLPAVTFADQSQVKPGDPLIAIGYPLSSSGPPSVTRGICSSIRMFEDYVVGEWVQTDAAMNPGNSGGPLATMRGEVVGLNSWILRLVRGLPIEGMNYALSVNAIKDFLPALLMIAGEMPPGAVPASPEIAQEVGDFVRRQNDAQILAGSTLDPSPLRDFESPVLYGRTVIELKALKTLGIRQESKLLEFQVKSAYELPDGLVAVDLFERWHSKAFRGDALIKDMGQTDQPQVQIVKRTPTGWQQIAIEWRGVSPSAASASAAPPTGGPYTPDVKAMDDQSAGPGAGLKQMILDIDGEWASFWKWRPRRPVTIYLYSDGNRMAADAEKLSGVALSQQGKEYLVREQACSFRDAATGGWVVMLTFNGAAWGAPWEQTKAKHKLVHEYSHIMVADQDAKNLPIWLIEGLGEYCAFAKDPKSVASYGNLSSTASYFHTGRLPTLKQLTGVVWYTLVLSGEPGKQGAYGAAYLAVKYLVEKVGGERVTQLLQATSTGEGFEAALQRIAGYSVNQLDIEYRSTIPRAGWTR